MVYTLFSEWRHEHSSASQIPYQQQPNAPFLQANEQASGCKPHQVTSMEFGSQIWNSEITGEVESRRRTLGWGPRFESRRFHIYEKSSVSLSTYRWNSLVHIISAIISSNDTDTGAGWWIWFYWEHVPYLQNWKGFNDWGCMLYQRSFYRCDSTGCTSLTYRTEKVHHLIGVSWM